MAYRSNTSWLVPVVLIGAVILAAAWTMTSRPTTPRRPATITDGGVSEGGP
ncbi:MAG: hypothetical protein R3B82_14520 [Sandaracinaceae bacterium]